MTQTAWRVAGASVQGTSHEADGTPCQDAHAYAELQNGTLLIAIADGAGSAKHSEEGAERAVSQCISELSTLLKSEAPGDRQTWKPLVTRAVEAAREELVSHARARQISVRDLACTLICAIVTDDQLVFGQVGDGAVVSQDDSGFVHTVIAPSRGEYANETSFIVEADALDTMNVAWFSGRTQALFLTTDGLLRLLFALPSYTPHAPFFGAMMRFVGSADAHTETSEIEANLAKFLESDRVNARTDDDKTLVIALRYGTAGEVALIEPVVAAEELVEEPAAALEAADPESGVGSGPAQAPLSASERTTGESSESGEAAEQAVEPQAEPLAVNEEEQ